MRYVGLFFLLLLSISGRSSFEPMVLDTHYIHQEVNKYLPFKNPYSFNNFFFVDLIQVSDSISYYLPSGSLHLFELKISDSIEVTPIRISPYNGHNFGACRFWYDSTLYNFGGYGLFDFTDKLIKFDWVRKEWFEEQEIKNFPKNIERIKYAWLRGDSLHFVHQFNSTNTGYSYGLIDMKQLTYYHLYEYSSKLNFDNAYFAGITHCGKEFNLAVRGIAKQKKIALGFFNKRTGEYFYTNYFDKLEQLNGTNAYWVSDSVLYRRNSDLKVDSIHLSKVIFFDYVPFLKPVIDRANDNWINNNYYFLLLVVMLIGGLLLIRFFKYKKRNQLEDKSFNELETEHYEQLLAPYINQVLSADELDVLLEIAELSYDSKKSKRSALIKQINELGGPQIIRQRSASDKRYFEYLVN